MKALLIPVKDPANAKTRLAGLLSADERRRLAWAMFEDVSRAVAGATKMDELLSADLRAPAALLVPSREGTGTNAIIRTPPAVFPSRFGPNSLALHKEEAARVGVNCVVVPNARIALDIDEPSDLELLIEGGRGASAYGALKEMNVEERLKR
jgi:2-phospho-L-lactate guanylyltransferase (CobY/MobA/RfbA family)